MFTGDDLELFVNKQLVYRGAIAANRLERTFGLFHYEGDTEIRVRNVQWKGEWPKIWSMIRNFETKRPTNSRRCVAAATKEFSHDFGKSGLPLNFFQIQDQGAEEVR